LTDQNDSKEAIRCSDSEFSSYINALEQSAGCDVLAAPRVTTTQGCQAFLQIPDTVMIAGVSHAVGLSLDVLPALSADGASVDLTSIARYTTPDPDALDATGQ
jgi:type II secretory pathway component GspD/PulD (secretin)